MFICAVTRKPSKPGEKPTRLVLETRPKVYRDKDGNVLGRGTEIVEEVNVSPEGMRLLAREAA